MLPAKLLGITATLACFAVTYALTLRLCGSAELETRRLAAALAVLVQAAFSPTAFTEDTAAVAHACTAAFCFFAELGNRDPNSTPGGGCAELL